MTSLCALLGIDCPEKISLWEQAKEQGKEKGIAFIAKLYAIILNQRKDCAIAAVCLILIMAISKVRPIEISQFFLKAMLFIRFSYITG